MTARIRPLNPQNQTIMNTIAKWTGFLSLTLLCGLAGTGCSSLGKPASASFASVNIRGKTPAEIRDATVAVFFENGYQVFPAQQGLIFEKEGTKGNTIAHAGLIASHYGAVTIIRVRVSLVAIGQDAWRLQCQAAMVSGAGDAFFEEEHPIPDYRSGPYQDLLDAAAKKLQQP